ncbi:hypothetical protein NEOLI_005108 [Neolecta irregularis DAH-3]|uniref:Uncharacterized protein n=1 Tax=Neolecta irregularis (strain DAH-3) TaxID=1198029 RepID=A0A1U7LP42_NEOID|nr:hypothetical protein NEOLI_005108 [Neolecta irregularis DAH-3]|eukprot:OLL24440.1 hypothetical protein NEOLI_005108 [Neolecta irregularis DAH-3]
MSASRLMNYIGRTKMMKALNRTSCYYRMQISQSLSTGSSRAVKLNSRDLEQLPQQWPFEGSEEEKERYSELLSNLISISSAVSASKSKHVYYSHLHDLVMSYSDPQKTVQSNLVTRDGPIDQELRRMRILAAKIGAKLEGKRFKRKAEEIVTFGLANEKIAKLVGVDFLQSDKEHNTEYGQGDDEDFN